MIDLLDVLYIKGMLVGKNQKKQQSAFTLWIESWTLDSVAYFNKGIIINGRKAGWSSLFEIKQ